MSRNFGLGSRDMARAGEYALKASARESHTSFASAATVAERWSQFCTWAKERDIKKMENISKEIVLQYGKELALKVTQKELAPATAQNYLSAVNSVMALATKGSWRSVSPTKECGIEKRSLVRTDTPKSLDRATYQKALEAVKVMHGDKAAAIVILCRELGLRSKEASLIDARDALKAAEREGKVPIHEGTKGGRDREIPATPAALEALRQAAQAQGPDKGVMPARDDWQSWREGGLREVRELVQAHTGADLRDLRAAYACERYQELTGHLPKVAGGQVSDKELDLAARLQIAAELGHGDARLDVTASYLGGR